MTVPASASACARRKLASVRPALAIAIAAGMLALLPLARMPAFYESLLYLVFHWIVLATSWNILSGYAGYFSFGHGAFFGAGLYTTATATSKFDWSFLASLPLATAVAALLGVALGAVVFRVRSVRGELFALLTLAATFVLATIVVNTPLDGGPGVYLNAVPVPAIGPTASSTFYLLALGAATVTMLASWSIFASRFGAGLFAIHDDEDVAEGVGVPTFRWKLLALATSSALAGLAGGIHALFISYVTASEVFNITVPLTVVLMSILGGTRHWAGPAIGAIVITALLYSFTGGELAILGKAATGTVLVAAILFMPDGIVARIGRRRPRGDIARVAPATAAAAATPVEPDPEMLADAPVVVTDVASNPGRDGDDVLLSARGLAKSFRGLHALRGVDVDVRRGEILGLVGPNGSGKSTFINLVSGQFAPTAGTVRLEQRDITGLPGHRIAQAGIARTFQIPRPFAHLSILDNVAIAAMYGRSRAPTVGQGRSQARQWLDFCHLAARADARPQDLNLHQRKFLELARALAARPTLVMLDEVLCGLTPAETREAVAMIRRIRDQGSTVVFVEHVMDAVMALTDRIVVFDQGRVLAEGAAAEVMTRPEVMTAYLGIGDA
jgi:branched-chain amino acid transport system permease protein